MARDLRWLCRYDEALDVSRKLADLMDARGEPWNVNRLEMFSGVAVSLRWAGYYPEARELAEDVYRRYVDFAGEDDRYTLMAATNLICDRRIVGDLVQAEELGRATVAAWKRIVGPGHPNTLSAQANLSTVLRARQFPSAAREMNQAALDGFRRLFPAYAHPSTLIVMTNLASDLAAVGEVREARAIGEEAIAMSQGSRGEGNLFTLVTAANLSLDLRATGDPDAAVELLAKTLAAFDETQGAEHPRTVQARHGGRLNLDIEPTYR
jgi:tetratricopeptide (TPR) repeat protein